MMMMTGGLTCRDIADRASAFVDGEISGVAWLRFKMHLLGCGPCADYIRQMGITIDALRDLPGPGGEGSREAVMALFNEWKQTQDDS
jgi:hypothetical protein